MAIDLGPSIGVYRGKPIPEYIVEEDGIRSNFNRIAVETDGGVELSQLGRHEVVISPGLIYRRVAQ